MKAVNLLPSDQRGPAKAPAAAAAPGASGGSFGAWLVIGALGFAVLATAAYVLATNTIKDRKAELARVQQEASVMKAKAQALQSYADFKAVADQRVQTVQGLAGARFDWERTLGDLSRALPSDVYLNGLTGSTNASSASGGSGLRGAIQAPAVELSGCTSTQQNIATLMSRLRAVRGVSRVALSKSDAEATSTVTSQTADGGTAAQPCPKGSAPTFDLVVFFERAQLPASAAPNLPGTTGSTTGTAPGTSTTPGAGSTSTTTPGGTTQPGTTSPSTTQPSTGATGATQGVSTK